MIKIVHIPIYRCSVIFMIGTTREQWDKFYAEESKKGRLTASDNLNVVEEYDLETPGFCVKTDGMDYITKIDTNASYGHVAHEIFHTAHFCLSDRGYNAEGSAEPLAYLIEFLTDEFYNTLNIIKIKANK